MKFTKVIRRLLHLLYFLGAPVFISCFFLSSACFADSVPITITLDGTQTWHTVCNFSDCQTFIGSHSYLVIEYDSGSSPLKYNGILNGLCNINMALYPGLHFFAVSKIDLQSSGIMFRNLNSVVGFLKVSVADSLPGSPPSCPSCPTTEGTLDITENGTFDVSDYEYAFVDVPPEPGDYDDEFESIRNAILICAGVALVIYFFYMIYGVLIGSSKR